VIPWLADDLDRLADLVAAGALLQVTAAALTGDYGRAPGEHAWQMVEAGLVAFVASDAHSPGWRPPGLSTARAAITRRCGAAVAERLLSDNAARVVAGEPQLSSLRPLHGAQP
jgi:protein-tyrosine phosphatase